MHATGLHEVFKVLGFDAASDGRALRSLLEGGAMVQARVRASRVSRWTALRDDLVPLNRKYPLAELMDACLRYLPHAPRDFITFEYCMLDGVNDQPQHAQELLALVRGHAGRGVGVDARCGLTGRARFSAAR